MNRLRAVVFMLAVLVPAPISAAESVPAAESIIVQQRNGAYEITVPVSNLVASFPRGELKREKGSDGALGSSRYFYLEDAAQHLIISGWFEPSADYPGIKASWEETTRGWRDNGLPEPSAVSFARISDWDAIYYDMTLPFGSNTHLLAHWVQAGTWIDLHLSITSDGAILENRAKLKGVLKSVRVRQKQ